MNLNQTNNRQIDGEEQENVELKNNTITQAYIFSMILENLKQYGQKLVFAEHNGNYVSFADIAVVSANDNKLFRLTLTEHTVS
ncbi:MAG: hypothetical protein LBU60_04350 [Clostridiales bacterium]|jgi:hypothetical protein|nr:hypothetical protein [Clostridiales bacterium]